MPDQAELRRFLSEKLPVYMHPSVIVPLAEWPLTANGKIDYQQLKTLKQQHQEKAILAPRDQVEFKLARIWENILHVWPVSITDNFFELGGHSILAVALIAQIQSTFGHDLPVTTLFQNPTIEKLATVLRHYTDTDQWQTIVPIQTGGSRSPLFCVHPSGGTAFCYSNLARCLGPDQPVYGIQAPDPTAWGQSTFSVVELASRYITALRQTQSQGPYFLGGWSAGGVIAFEMACQLHRQGEKVALLALFDSSAPASPATPLTLPDLRDPALARSIIEELQLASSAQALDDLPEEERLAYVLEQAKIQQRVPQDIDIVQLRRFTHMQKKLLYSLRSYTPAVYTGRITLFRTQASVEIESKRVPSQDEMVANKPVDPWAKLSTNELELHIVPGEHATLMNEPDVSALASILSRYLTRTTVERA
jgi:thioesterase domain-containing protein/acyl carrier protein